MQPKLSHATWKKREQTYRITKFEMHAKVMTFILGKNTKCHCSFPIDSEWYQPPTERRGPLYLAADGRGARKLSRVWTKTNTCRTHHYKAHCQQCVAPCLHSLCKWYMCPLTSVALTFTNKYGLFTFVFSDILEVDLWQKKPLDICRNATLKRVTFYISALRNPTKG